MNNRYVTMYCEYFNLVIHHSIKVPGENYIVEGGQRVGFYRNDSKYIEFNNEDKTYKKSDLLSFILEDTRAHWG